MSTTNFSLIDFELDPIVIEGNDLVVDDVQLPIKQLIVCSDFKYAFDIDKILQRKKAFENNPDPVLPQYMPGYVNPEPRGNSVSVTIHALFFKRNGDGTYGERLQSSNVAEYTRTFTADNTVIIEEGTGAYLGTREELADPVHSQPPLFDNEGIQVQQAGKFYGKTIMKEGKFFDRRAKQEPTLIINFLETFITANKQRVQPPKHY